MLEAHRVVGQDLQEELKDLLARLEVAQAVLRGLPVQERRRVRQELELISRLETLLERIQA